MSIKKEPAGQTALVLKSAIDSATIEHVERQLVAVFYGRLLAHRARFIIPKHVVRPLSLALRWISLGGFVMGLVLAIFGSLSGDELAIVLTIAAFFALIFPLTWNQGLILNWWVTPWPAYWTCLAKIHTRSMLKKAKRSVPFEAEYDFRDDLVVYFRRREEHSDLVWSRHLKGLSLSCDGFTLLYKKEKAVSPYLILLHPPSSELDAYLDRQGIHPLAAHAMSIRR